MKVDRLVLGEFENHCYIVRNNDSAAECLVIDTALDDEDEKEHDSEDEK